MSTLQDQFRQFQIPDSNAVDVPLTDNSHDQNHMYEASTYNERLGLDEAAADVERRQREVDFTENQSETTKVYHEAMSAIEKTAVVIDLRASSGNDNGTVNGVKAA